MLIADWSAHSYIATSAWALPRHLLSLSLSTSLLLTSLLLTSLLLLNFFRTQGHHSLTPSLQLPQCLSLSLSVSVSLPTFLELEHSVTI